MKYIGPFFRMNSISTKEIESQLLFLCRESVKHIVLESRFGISVTNKNLRTYMDNDDLSKFKNNNPIICIYKKAKPNIYSSKYSRSWDDSTFKKEIPISSNALMTLSLLECTRYYDKFKDIDDILFSTSKLYKTLSKLQLEFYYNYLRNNEGFFIDKKNSDNSTNAEPNLYEKDKKYRFSDQAYMMLSYYLYSITCDDDPDKQQYKSFSLEILEMFLHFKDDIYNLSLEECLKITFCFNVMYEYSQDEKCKQFLIDICDFTLSKYNETNPSLSNLETATLMSLNLIMCYENTNITLFKDSFSDIIKLLTNLYDVNKNIIQKPNDKKETKYSSTEIIQYLLNMIIYYKYENNKDTNNLICQVYKQYCITSGMITSFPEAPNLDSAERYVNLSLRSIDLLDETMFRMPNSSSSELTGLAPTFVKNINYSSKKENFTTDKNTFDSNRNMFLFFSTLHLLLPDYMKALINTTSEENNYIHSTIIKDTSNSDSNNNLLNEHFYNKKFIENNVESSQEDTNSKHLLPKSEDNI